MGLAQRYEASSELGVRKRFKQLALKNNIPFNVTIELTQKCNWKCVHCYNFDRTQTGPVKTTSQELSSAEILELIDELAEAGCFDLTFTGGEIFLHPQLIDFVRRARAHHLNVGLKSNGSLFSEARFLELSELGVQKLDLSLYGARSQTHDALTQIPGSFEKTLKAARLARKNGWRLRLNIALHRGNFLELEEMLTLGGALEASLGVDTNITSRYDGTKTSMDLRLNAEQLRFLYRGPLAHLLKEPVFEENRTMQCACAIGKCAISSSGEVYPCIGAPIPSGNIRQQKFMEIWQNSPVLNRIRRLGKDDFETCKDCSLKPYCKRSSGSVYVNTGDYTGAEAWVCEQAVILKECHRERDGDETFPLMSNK